MNNREVPLDSNSVKVKLSNKKSDKSKILIAPCPEIIHIAGYRRPGVLKWTTDSSQRLTGELKDKQILEPITKKASKILRTPTGLQSSDIPMIKRKHLSPQHIYILSSEEIKEGESSWIINKNRDTIYFIKNAQKDEDELKGINKNWNKIIATTDILLTDYIKVEGGFGSCYNKLPRPSDDFLKAFVKANGKGFDKVLVEYEGYGFKRLDLERKPRRAGYQLKVLPDNTITIKPIQEKTS